MGKHTKAGRRASFRAYTSRKRRRRFSRAEKYLLGMGIAYVAIGSR